MPYRLTKSSCKIERKETLCFPLVLRDKWISKFVACRSSIFRQSATEKNNTTDAPPPRSSATNRFIPFPTPEGNARHANYRDDDRGKYSRSCSPALFVARNNCRDSDDKKGKRKKNRKSWKKRRKAVGFLREEVEHPGLPLPELFARQSLRFSTRLPK